MRSSESEVGSRQRQRESEVESLSVDGVVASDIVVPEDAQATANVLADANARGHAVAPMGGGTALGMGNPPERIDVIVSTARLGGIIDYEPTDLVLSVGAGARFGDVQAVLAEHGQRLPLDPPGGADATIGGLIATARHGPLRYSAGTLRDLLIGIAVAHPGGTVSRAGGMVVKNVSGYDMPRLYHGSLGTLGVIVSANFKVLPRPRAEATVIAGFAELSSAFTQAALVRQSQEPIAAVEVAWQESRWLLAVRIEGRDATVDAAASRIASRLTSDDITRFDGESSSAWWKAYVAEQHAEANDGSLLVRAGARPRDTPVLAAGLAESLPERGISLPFMAASPGLGSVIARLDFGDGGSPERLAEAQGVLQALAETTTILAAPPSWKQGIDVWGRLPDGFEVMRTLRQQFDPLRTINPGRFAGFL